MAEYADRERFIPVGKADLVDRLAHSRMVPPHSRETFLRLTKILDSIFHFYENAGGYLFLMNTDAGTTASALDDAIEDWFKKTYAVPVDFEIEDALGKLTRLNLFKITGKDDTGALVCKAVPLSDAWERLDVMLDNFFTRA